MDAKNGEIAEVFDIKLFVKTPCNAKFISLIEMGRSA